MTIIAFDPGIKNYGYSALSTEPLNIIKAGHLKNPISSIKQDSLKESIKLHLWEINDLLEHIGFRDTQDKIIIERYQSRGYRNLQLELVNVMLGVLLGHYDALPVMPATWKTFIKRHYGSNDMMHLLQNSNLSPHMADATGMAIYYAEKYCDREKLVDQLKSVMYSWIVEC